MNVYRMLVEIEVTETSPIHAERALWWLGAGGMHYELVEGPMMVRKETCPPLRTQ